ncbi:HNH endonuclease family protein [Pontibacterium sp.]|uniref:HNH endonuclease family protein n=1 Tax=Pontibacterium sp. TaxID=2036026 RepID=UPI00351801D0
MHSNSVVVNSPAFSIEHIHSRSMTGGEVSEDLVNSIGNLTLLTLEENVRCGDGSFAKKSPFYKKSSLVIAREVAEKFEEWNKKAIELRAKRVVNDIASIMLLGRELA